LGLVLAFTLGKGKQSGGTGSPSSSQIDQNTPDRQIQAPAGWKVVSAPEYGIEVLMPDSAKHPLKPDISKNGHVYQVRTKDGQWATTYTLSCERIKRYPVEKQKATLAALVDLRVSEWPGGKVRGRWWISIGDSPGLDVHIYQGHIEEKLRYFIVDDRLIRQSIYAEHDMITLDSESRRFLESLRVDGLPFTGPK
jgi:hypothetical protein